MLRPLIGSTIFTVHAENGDHSNEKFRHKRNATKLTPFCEDVMYRSIVSAIGFAFTISAASDTMVTMQHQVYDCSKVPGVSVA
jgi:hypothetical protein